MLRMKNYPAVVTIEIRMMRFDYRSIMKSYIITLWVGTLFCSCQPKYEMWTFDSEVSLGQISPIGITKNSEGYWISDGDHNRLIQLNSELKVTKRQEGYDRPMHLVSHDETIYVPEYGADKISVYASEKKDSLLIPFELDAPASIDVKGEQIAIADFYHHRVLFFDGNDWISMGQEGHEVGQLYYPTDVQIMQDKIAVADAYNNRIQLFSKEGNVLKEIGKDQKMNAATGIFANANEIYVTDFENDRILAFDYEGNMLQEFIQGLEKPTDVYVENNQLLVINYKKKSIAKYTKK